MSCLDMIKGCLPSSSQSFPWPSWWIPKLFTDHKIFEHHTEMFNKNVLVDKSPKPFQQCTSMRRLVLFFFIYIIIIIIWSDSLAIWWASYSINHTLVGMRDRPVAHLMSNGESHRQPRVLVDVAAAVRLTHPGQMGQTQSLTGLVHSRTDVFPRDISQVRRPCCVTPSDRCGRATYLVIKTATSWWAGCVSLWGFRFFCQAQKLDRVVSAWWTIFNPFCNREAH